MSGGRSQHPLDMFPQQLGWSYTSPSYFRKSWIVSLGNVKNSFRVSLPKQRQGEYEMVLTGVLGQALLLLCPFSGFCSVMKKKQNKTKQSSSQQWIETGLDWSSSPMCHAAQTCWLSLLFVKPRRELPATLVGDGPVGPVVWLSSPHQSPSSPGAVLGRCSVWGHGCPGCYGNGARLDAGVIAALLLSLLTRWTLLLLRTPNRAKPVEGVWGDVSQEGQGQGAQCSSPSAF